MQGPPQDLFRSTLLDRTEGRQEGGRVRNEAPSQQVQQRAKALRMGFAGRRSELLLRAAPIRVLLPVRTTTPMPAPSVH